MIDDAMSSPEGREGTHGWQQELERRHRAHQAREEALARVSGIQSYIASKLEFPEATRESYLDVLTLWALHNYSYKAAGVVPILPVVAPTFGSGKTQVGNVLCTLVSNPSPVLDSRCDRRRPVAGNQGRP